MYSGIWRGCRRLVSWSWSKFTGHVYVNCGADLHSPHQVRQIKFNDFLAGKRPSVQERWLGPRSPLPEYETEEEEDGEEEENEEEEEGPEQDEVEGRDQGQVSGHDQEDRHDKAASHQPSIDDSILLVCRPGGNLVRVNRQPSSDSHKDLSVFEHC